MRPQQERKNGATRTTAEEAASSRLGEPDHLVESALARPEPLSWSRRWPWAVYGLEPLLFFAAAFVAMILAMIGLLGLANNPTGCAIPTPPLEVLRMGVDHTHYLRRRSA
jgi:hypothetical protein